MVDKSRAKKGRDLPILLSSLLRLPLAKSYKRSSFPRNSLEQALTSGGTPQCELAFKATQCDANAPPRAKAFGSSDAICHDCDRYSDCVSHPNHHSDSHSLSRPHCCHQQTSTVSVPGRPKSMYNYRAPHDATGGKKGPSASPPVSNGQLEPSTVQLCSATQCAPGCTVARRARASPKLHAALQCLEHVAEYLQQIISRHMVTLLPGLCSVLFEILEEIYHLGICDPQPFASCTATQPAEATPSSSLKRQKSLCATLLSLIHELDVLLIDFYGSQLGPTSKFARLLGEELKRKPLHSVRLASVAVLTRHKAALERHIADLLSAIKQPQTVACESSETRAAHCLPTPNMAQVGNAQTAATGVPVTGSAGLSDDELSEQINTLSRKIHHLACNFGRISNTETNDAQSIACCSQNPVAASLSEHAAAGGVQQLAESCANTGMHRELEGKHIVIEQIQVHKTEHPEHPQADNAAQASADATSKPFSAADGRVERQACIEPTTVTQSQERVEYDTVIGEDGRAYRRKRIIRKHVSTTHECEIIYSKKEQKVTPAMFLGNAQGSQLQLPAAGVQTNKRCVDQYIQIMGKYKEGADTSCAAVDPNDQQRLASLLAKSREYQGVPASADPSTFASFQSLWRKQEIEVVYSKPRTNSSSSASSEAGKNEHQVIIDDTNILPEEQTILEQHNADNLLVFRADNDDGPYLRGGTVVALIVHACAHAPTQTQPLCLSQRLTVSSDDYALFQRVFLATYRTMISSRRMCEMLIRRYMHFAKADSQAQSTPASTGAGNSSRPASSSSVGSQNQDMMARTAKFMLAVVNELGSDLVTPSDNDSSLVNALCSFTTQLMEQFNNIKLANAIHSRVFEILNGLHQTKITQPLVSLYAGEACSTELTVAALLQFRSINIAQQLTLIDAELFGRIETKELLTWAQDQNEELCPNFTAFTEQFNNLSYWVRTLILNDINANANRDRERLIVKFIKIMKHLRKLNNFNALIALSAALGSAPVRRLEWSRSIQESIDEFSQVIDSSSSFKNYRHALSQALQQIAALSSTNTTTLSAATNASPASSEKLNQTATTAAGSDASGSQATAVIPYIGVMLTDLTFIHQGNKSFLVPKDGEKKPLWQTPVNMGKRWQQFNSLDVFIRIRQMRYVGLQRDEKILRCFNGFRDFMDEEQQWAVFETIKSHM